MFRPIDTIKKIIFCIVSASAVVLVSSSSSPPTYLHEKGTRIIQLTDDNFEYLVQASSGQTSGKWLVNFSSSQCGHCAKLAPHWSKLAEEMTLNRPEDGVLIGNVNIRENPKLVQRFGITAMPTILFFADRGMYEYDSHRPRLVEDFVTFATGGYREDKKKEVPTHGGVLKVIEDMRRAVYEFKVLRDLLTDFEEIIMLRKNAAALLFLSGVVFGLFCGSILGLTRRRTSSSTNHNSIKEVKDKKA